MSVGIFSSSESASARASQPLPRRFDEQDNKFQFTKNLRDTLILMISLKEIEQLR